MIGEVQAAGGGGPGAHRLLLVAYEFPPKGGTAAQQVAKTALGLARRGWHVCVLTVADPPTALRDEPLLREVTGHVEVITSYSLEPTRIVQVARRLTRAVRRSRERPNAAEDPGATVIPRGFTSLPPWLIRLIQALFLPDEKIGWAPWAARAAFRCHAERPFSVVVSTGPPFSAHVVAGRIARNTGIPWVADLRDPVVGGYFFRPCTPLHGWWMRRFEARVVARAEAVTVATEGMADDLVARYPPFSSKLVTLPNGFDGRQFEAAVQGRPARTSDDTRETFTISYVGTFQGSIRSDVFLAAVSRIVRIDADVARRLRVRLVGPLDAETEQTVRRLGLEARVSRTGFVSHEDALVEMLGADLLLLVLGPEVESRVIQTSKLPEYLRAGKPVLALVPEGIAADIVRRSGCGEVAHPLDVAAAADSLLRLYEAWKRGDQGAPDPFVVKEFDQDVIVERLDSLLQELVHNRFPPPFARADSAD